MISKVLGHLEYNKNFRLQPKCYLHWINEEVKKLKGFELARSSHACMIERFEKDKTSRYYMESLRNVESGTLAWFYPKCEKLSVNECKDAVTNSFNSLGCKMSVYNDVYCRLTVGKDTGRVECRYDSKSCDMPKEMPRGKTCLINDEVIKAPDIFPDGFICKWKNPKDEF